MAKRQPASASFFAIAHAMLRLFANPKITAVFCPSLIPFLSYNLRSLPSVPSPRPLCESLLTLRLCVIFSLSFSFFLFLSSNPLKCLLNLLHRIPQHHRPPMRTTHRTIRFRQRPKQPFHFRLIQRHIYFDRRVARRRSRNLRLQSIN